MVRSRLSVIALCALGLTGCASGSYVPTTAADGLNSALSPDSRSPDSLSPAGSPAASQQQAVPSYLRAACGHPGAQVTLPTVPITVPRDLCDLTGVVVLYGQTGVTVPSDGGVEAIADFTWGASELGANVDPVTRDVTFS
jgi:hypothetical protein